MLDNVLMSQDEEVEVIYAGGDDGSLFSHSDAVQALAG